MVKAIILATQRSGSTFLQDCLKSHPEVISHGELLKHGMGFRVPDLVYQFRWVTKLTQFAFSGAWHPTRMMDRFYATGDAKAKVFKAMYNQVSVPWTRAYVARHTEIRILHLRRENLLKQYVSFLLMGRPRVKRWQTHVTEPIPPLRLTVSPEAALRYMRNAAALYPRHEQIFSQHRRLPLVYEDMIDGRHLRADLADAVCDFLEVSRRPLVSKLIKINPEDLREFVINYDELASVVRRSEFAHFLE